MSEERPQKIDAEDPDDGNGEAPAEPVISRDDLLIRESMELIPPPSEKERI